MIVGNFVGEDALAAVGASYALTNVFIMIAIGGGNGASVLTSQYLGARQYGKMKTSISTALITFLFVSILLGSAGLYLNGLILESLKTPANIMGQAKLYLGIYFLGMPFLFMYNVLAAIFNAMGGFQDASVPSHIFIHPERGSGHYICHMAGDGGGRCGHCHCHGPGNIRPDILRHPDEKN